MQERLTEKNDPGFIYTVHITVIVHIMMTETQKPNGLLYFPDVLTVSEEQDLLSDLTLESDLDPESVWKTAGARANRLVRHYGYNYPYTRKLELTPADPIPVSIIQIIHKLAQFPGLKDFHPDQAIINRYLTGEGISKHVDHVALFGDTVVSVSLGCNGKMRFRRDEESYDITVSRRSVYAMTGESRYDWTHEMPKSKSQCGVRFSITFREINHKYLKGTAHSAIPEAAVDVEVDPVPVPVPVPVKFIVTKVKAKVNAK